MKVSLSELLLLINKKDEEVSENYQDVLKNSMVTKDREIGTGVETILNTVEDFKTIQCKYEKSISDLIRYKNALALANSSIRLMNGQTIIEAINTIGALKREFTLYDALLCKKATLNRMFDGSGGSSYYRVNDLNFEISDVKNRREELRNKISELEANIANTNATSFIEI